MRKLFPVILALGLLLTACGAKTAATPTPAPETAPPAQTNTGGYDVPGEEPAPGDTAPAATDGLEGSYYNDYLRRTLTLDGAGGFVLSGAEAAESGAYTAAGDALTLDFASGPAAAEIDADGDLTVAGYTGYFLKDWEKWGVTDAEAGPSLSDAGAGARVGDDGSRRYRDVENGVAFTYTADMEVLRGTLVSAAAATDGKGGYVTGRNVTELYFTNPGTDDDFIEDYVRAFVFGDFTELYGSETLGYDGLTLLHEGIDGRLAGATLTVRGADASAAVKTILYTSTYPDGTVNYIVKTVFAPADAPAWIDVLSAAVSDMGAVRLTED